MVTTALTLAPTSVPLNEPVGPADGPVDVSLPLQAASSRPVRITIQVRIRGIRRPCRQKSNRPSGGAPTWPVACLPAGRGCDGGADEERYQEGAWGGVRPGE